MRAGGAVPPGREAWFGALFFVLLGGLVLALDPGGLIGWVSLSAGVLSGLALWAVRQGWWIAPGPARPRPRPAPADDGAVVASRGVQPHPLQPGRQAPGQAIPFLSAEGRRRVEEIVAVLDRARLWAPATPDPALLYPAVADRGEPVAVADVLHALSEVTFHFPDADPEAFSQRLAVHVNGVEQSADHLAEQATDLARLAGGTVAVEVHDVRQEPLGSPARGVRTRLEVSVGGEPLSLDYVGSGTYVSTVLHVHLARALRRAGSPYRIAWLQDDHIILAGLPDGDLDALNADLGLRPADPLGVGGWTWVDVCEPVALGEADAQQ